MRFRYEINFRVRLTAYVLLDTAIIGWLEKDTDHWGAIKVNGS